MRAVNVIAVAAVLGAASSVAAQGLVPKPGGAFTPPPQSKYAKRLEPPSVVCGMTVIPAMPEVDPKSIKKAPTDKQYTMRSVPRPSCSHESSTVVVPPPTVAPR